MCVLRDTVQHLISFKCSCAFCMYRSDAIALSNAGTWVYNLFVAFSFPPLTTAFGNPKVVVVGSRLSGSGVMFIVFGCVSVGCAYVVWKHVHPAEEEERTSWGGTTGYNRFGGNRCSCVHT